VSLDPAGVGDCGVALRVMPVDYDPEHLPAPVYTYSGSVWNGGLHDDLGLHLSRLLPSGGNVVFAAEGTAYGTRATVKWIYRSMGALECTLSYLNWCTPKDTITVPAHVWRPREWTSSVKGMSKDAARAELKRLAVEEVARRYTLELDEHAAEAVLIGDYAAVAYATKVQRVVA